VIAYVVLDWSDHTLFEQTKTTTTTMADQFMKCDPCGQSNVDNKTAMNEYGCGVSP
jgi:hypothetical protein